MQLTSTLRVDANATLAQNKIALFEETVYDYDENFSYVNVIEHENTDIALSPNAVAMGMLTFEAPEDGALAGLSFSLIGKHVGRQFLDNTSNEDRRWMPTPRWMRWFARSATLSTGQQVTLSVFGNNLTDALYSATGWTYSYRYGGEESTVTENYVYPQAGRHGFVTLAVAF